MVAPTTQGRHTIYSVIRKRDVGNALLTVWAKNYPMHPSIRSVARREAHVSMVTSLLFITHGSRNASTTLAAFTNQILSHWTSSRRKTFWDQGGAPKKWVLRMMQIMESYLGPPNPADQFSFSFLERRSRRIMWDSRSGRIGGWVCILGRVLAQSTCSSQRG